MARILFTHSYFLRFDPKQWKLRKPYPPLGTIYAAAQLRAEGHEVDLHDVMFAQGPEDLIPVMDRFRPDYLVVYDDGFNYLTKMCLTNMREAAWEMSRLAKKRGLKVAVCSSDSTDHYAEYLRHGADVVILGEGEAGLGEWVKTCEEGQSDLSSIAGIAWMPEDEAVKTAPRPVLRDLDALEPPAWDLIDIKPYQAAWAKHGRFSINMATTRGCPYKCNWCAKPIYGNRYHSHAAEAKAEELARLVRDFHAEHIWFGDDIFGLKPGWVPAFSEGLRTRKLHIPFMIQSRVDLMLREGEVDALAEAGCETVWLGAESGSQKILDAMDKGVTVEQIHKARKLLGAKGIEVAFFLQFGYLGEEMEDIAATFSMIEKAMPDDIGVSVSYPLPGTSFYDKVKAEMADKTNWTDSDELALMFRNTFRPEFYKRLHRYVHKRYRKAQAIEAWKGAGRGPRLRKALSGLYFAPAAAWERRKLAACLPQGEKINF